VQGNLLAEKESGQELLDLDLHSYSPGFYLVRIISGDRVITRRVNVIR